MAFETTQSTYIFPGEVFPNPAEFDRGIRQLLPHYEEMLDAIARCIPTTATRILELGCGTGELSLKVLQRCPSAHLVAVDYSPRMLFYAQEKLQQGGYGDRITWIEADFGAWANGQELILPPQMHSSYFDACVSSLAIHHLADEIKLKLLQTIHQHLQPGGSFWNADPVLPESPALAAIYQAVREDWASSQGTTLTAIRAQLGTSTPQGYSGHDRLASLAWHLEALTQAGFTSVAVPWKYYGLAVFGGFSSNLLG